MSASSRIIYLTFSDSPSGIFKSQVIDVVEMLNSKPSLSVTLVCFITIKDFFAQRKKIKSWNQQAIVLPQFPKLNNWSLNVRTLKLLFKLNKYQSFIGRGIFATNLLLKIKKPSQRVIYDGRGAIAAEQNEYNIYGGTDVENDIESLEKHAVIESDFRIGVSEKLINYWQSNFKYKTGNEVVIPCTLSFDSQITEEEAITKESLGWSEKDVVLIYSGSIAGWQSLESLGGFLKMLLKEDHRIRILFLCQSNDMVDELQSEFLDRVKRLWLDHEKVFSHLCMGDYGILLREQSMTNFVASPVKFAEYLSAGLKVIVSDNIGDFSEMVKVNGFGTVVNSFDEMPDLVINDDKENIRTFASLNFSKKQSDIQSKYLKAIETASPKEN